MACQAGKDVYSEKPASHNVVEGRRMVEAARKYKRIVQIGIQRRSMPHVMEAIKYVRDGGIGTVGMARAWIFKERERIGPGKPAEVPPGVDYAMWQGPAPDRPFMSNRFHYNWHWFWNWGTGELGNNGIHGLDVARWGLGVDAPLTVASGGGRFVFDDREVPDTQVVTYEFPKACLVWEHRLYDKHPMEGLGFGIAFYGDKGVLTVDEKGWKVRGRRRGRRQGDRRPGEPPDQLRRMRQVARPPQRRRRGRPPQHPALPPGQHRPPGRPEAPLRRRHRVIPRRRRGQRPALSRILVAVRDALAGLTRRSAMPPHSTYFDPIPPSGHDIKSLAAGGSIARHVVWFE